MKPKLDPIANVVSGVMKEIRKAHARERSKTSAAKAIHLEGQCPECKEWTTVAEPCCFKPIAVPGRGSYTPEDALLEDIEAGRICGCDSCQEGFLHGTHNPCEFDCVDYLTDLDPIPADEQRRICDGCKRVLIEIGARFEPSND